MKFKKYILFLMSSALLLIGTVLHAANGDLLVNGNAGIGTPTPTEKMHVTGNIRSDGSIYSTQYGHTAPVKLISYGLDGTDNIYVESGIGKHIFLTDHWGAQGRLIVQVGKTIFRTGDNGIGNVGIGIENPVYTLDVNGSFHANSGPGITSDAVFKKNIQPIFTPLSKVLMLNGATYEFRIDDFKDKTFPTGRHYGVIAQEIEKVIPEVVTTSPDGTKSVTYTEIIPVLIEAIKEQQKQIEELRTEIMKSKSRD